MNVPLERPRDGLVDLGLKNKVAVVTGGASGIGLATAQILLEAGASVVIAGRDAEKGASAIRHLRQTGPECHFVRADVSRQNDVEALFEQVDATFGRLDCAVNNAAVNMQKDFLDWAEAEWDYIVGVNLKGVWLCMMSEARLMLRGSGGSIVNISSTAGFLGVPQHTPYIAAKHGVHGLTRSASVELSAKGIRCNTVAPGVFWTPMLERGLKDAQGMAEGSIAQIPMGRIGDPRELAWAAVWLCSERASYTSGVAIGVDGGWSQH